jgi:hypothetical protein
MNVAYVVAECRPSTDKEGYADIVFDDQTYIFENVEAAENLKSAILITIDIERTKPKNKALILHEESLLKLLDSLKDK